MSSSNMNSVRPGGLKLFRLFDIDVYLHWAWAIVAYYSFQRRAPAYHQPLWAMAEILSLFAIVLMHEYGHALACRSTGGRAEYILLWPLGGVAFVNPPFRPGAMLWSIVAGPLVNVVLTPIFFGLYFGYSMMGGTPNPDVDQFLNSLLVINIVLLIFNMLPIYPLDGGKIVWSVLWFFIGPSRSLTIAAYTGLVGVAIGIGYALMVGDFWLVLIAGYAAFQCKRGLDDAKVLKYQEPVKRARVPDMISCPSCRKPPPQGPYWQCECGGLFDLPGENGRCPHCSRAHSVVVCPYCMAQASLLDWRTAPATA